MLEDILIKEFITSTKILYEKGYLNLLINSISIKINRDKMVINRKNKFIYEDFYSITPITSKNIGWKELTEDIEIHSKVYEEIKNTKSLIHIFPPNTMALFNTTDIFTPIDYLSESIKNEIKIINISSLSKWEENKAFLVTKNLKEYNILIIRGIGVFIKGKNIKNSIKKAILLEQSCKIINLIKGSSCI